MHPDFLPLADRLRSIPRPVEDFDPQLLERARAAGIVKTFPGAEHGELVMLTGTGVMEIVGSSQSRGGRELIMNLDITADGLVIKRHLTKEEWWQTLARLKLVQKTYALSLADLIHYGRDRYGAEFVDEKLEQLEFPLDEINRSDAIALVDHGMRQTYRLTSEHYYVLGRDRGDDKDLMEKWAAAAVKHSLSALALARSIANDQIITDTDIQTLSGRDSGIPTINGFGLTFVRWTKAAKAEENINKWSRQDKEKLLLELLPIVEFAAKVKATL
jgi:hypothetical protein